MAGALAAVDVGHLAHVGDRMQHTEPRVVAKGCIGDSMMPSATAFTRMPRLAYSIVSDLVAALRPPLVSPARLIGFVSAKNASMSSTKRRRQGDEAAASLRRTVALG